MKTEIEEIAGTLSDAMIVRLVWAYAERLDGDTGPMSTEAWYLAHSDSVNRALERRGLVENRASADWPWRLLSDRGVEVAAYVVEKYEITWGPKR